MSKLSNTHAAVFTTIPKSITKTWDNEPLDLSNNEILPSPKSKHEVSVLDKIELSVKFNELLLSNDTPLTRTSDTSFTMIELWKEARRDWAELEQAIEDVIDEFITRSRKRAASTGIESIDVPTHVLTETKIDTPKNLNSSITYQTTLPTHAPDLANWSTSSQRRPTGYAETLNTEPLARVRNNGKDHRTKKKHANSQLMHVRRRT